MELNHILTDIKYVLSLKQYRFQGVILLELISFSDKIFAWKISKSNFYKMNRTCNLLYINQTIVIFC